MAPTLALAPVLGDGEVDLRSANQKREYAHSHGGVGWSPSSPQPCQKLFTSWALVALAGRVALARRAN